MSENCHHALYEIDKLVAEFLCAFNHIRGDRSKSLHQSSDGGQMHTPRTLAKASTPHAAKPRRAMPKPLTPRQHFDDAEAETLGELEWQLPQLVLENVNNREPSWGTASHSNSSEVRDIVKSGDSGRGPPVTYVSSMHSSRAKEFSSNTLKSLIVTAAALQEERHSSICPSAKRIRANLDKLLQWIMVTPGDELVLKAVEPVMGFFILVNCILIGVSLDTESWDGWHIVDWFFALLYSVEICLKLRLLGCQELYFGIGWGWSAFDTLLVIVAILELLIRVSGFVLLFRILKLVRLTRLLRLLRLPFLKELIMLIHGMVGGARCLFWCMCFVSVPIFIAGIILSQVLKDWDEYGLFSSVPAAMFTTFRCMCGDCTDQHGRPLFLWVSKSRGWLFALFYTVFMLVFIFGIFNLVTAIFIEGTMQAAKSDSVLQSQIRKADDQRFSKNLKLLIFKLWVEREKAQGKRHHLSSFRSSEACKEFAVFNLENALELEIDQEFYQQLVRLPHVREVLDDMDMHDDDIENLFFILDRNRSGTLDVHELVCGLHKLRGETRKSDLVNLSFMIASVQDGIREVNQHVQRLFVEGRESRTGSDPPS